MAAVTLRAGMTLEIPNQKEIAAIVAEEHHRAAEAEFVKARGIKPVRIARPGPSPAAQTLYVVDAAPESGYLWNVKLISVQLASAGTCLAYIASSAPPTGATPQKAIANMSTSSTTQVATYSGVQALLYPDEGIFLSATQNINAVFISAIEVPAEMFAKIYS